MTEHANEICHGGCACGALRYQVMSAPMIVHACHCSLCQRQTGSSNAVNALIEADRIILHSGEIEHIMLDTPSGSGQRVARCNACKVAIWSNYLINKQDDDIRFLRVGTLDDPTRMPPDVHIYTVSKLPWYVIDNTVPAVPQFYHHDTTWSQASMERLAALATKSGVPYPKSRAKPASASMRAPMISKGIRQ